MHRAHVNGSGTVAPVALKNGSPLSRSGVYIHVVNIGCGLPPDVGRIPHRISFNYGGFTASQWQNWITIYSPVVLKGILEQHLQCWLLFVCACSLLSKRIITKEDAASADLFLVSFCKKYMEWMSLHLTCTFICI